MRPVPTDYLCGGTRDRDTRWHVPIDNSISAYSAIVAKGHAAEDDCTRADVDTITDYRSFAGVFAYVGTAVDATPASDARPVVYDNAAIVCDRQAWAEDARRYGDACLKGRSF